MQGASREELTWIAGWDTVKEIQNRRLGLIARAMKGRGTLRALWEDDALGAAQSTGGVLCWLRREHQSLYGYPDPDWSEVTLWERTRRCAVGSLLFYCFIVWRLLFHCSIVYASIVG